MRNAELRAEKPPARTHSVLAIIDGCFFSIIDGLRKNGRFLSPRKSPVTKYKTLTDSEAFILRHFAGAVCYNVNGFVDKNTDGLHDSLLKLCATAKHSILIKVSYRKQNTASFPKRCSQVMRNE